MRRLLLIGALLIPFAPARADALTVRDVIELSKAKVSDQVLLALIEVDRSVFTLDTAALKQLQEAGVSDAVIVALIRSGRTPDARTEPVPPPEPEQVSEGPATEPRVVVIDHHDAPAPPPVMVPVAVPVYVPVPAYRPEYVTRTVLTDEGAAVNVREALPPNCTKAEPVYWGNGGKRRPGTWEPPLQVVCR